MNLPHLLTDPKTGETVARAEPGILLGDFKKKVEEAGFFYPPDPTSYKEAQLGGTVATNATGEDTFFYGPTRKYVRELKILIASGEERILKRSRLPEIPSKNRAGYFLEGEDIDEMIGSEGTLGLITEVTAAVLPHPADHYLAAFCSGHRQRGGAKISRGGGREGLHRLVGAGRQAVADDAMGLYKEP